MRFPFWKTAAEMAAEFAAGRERQPDEAFLSECALPHTEHARRIALAVRRSVARYGMADPLYIKAGDQYPGDLDQLSGWDSIDFMSWVFELERELGFMRVERHWFSHLRGSFSVRDLAHAVYAHWRQQSESSEGR